MKNITLPDEEILIGSQFRGTKYKVIIFINVPHYFCLDNISARAKIQSIVAQP